MGPFIGRHSVIIARGVILLSVCWISSPLWDLRWSPNTDFSDIPYLQGGLGGGGVWSGLDHLHGRSYSLFLGSLVRVPLLLALFHTKMIIAAGAAL